MKKIVPLFEEFQHNNHVKFMNWLTQANADEIRQAYLNGDINTKLKKQVASQALGQLVANGDADEATRKLFHELSDEKIGDGL